MEKTMKRIIMVLLFVSITATTISLVDHLNPICDHTGTHLAVILWQICAGIWILRFYNQ